MVLSMERWKGKVAIVTGASSGIGASIAEQLVKNGLKVVGLARRSEKVEELSKTLAGEKGKLYAVKTDLSKEEDILNAFKWTKEHVGAVSILVNNAGVGQKNNLIEGDTKKWKMVFDVNVIGLCIATREAVKVMRENKIEGHIVHINSILGHKVFNFPGLNVYPASKFAVTALTETLRQELNQFGTKIKITSVSPGLVDTEMTTHNPNTPKETIEIFKTMPILKDEDIADGVLYVLSTPPHVQVHELTIKPVNESL